MFSTIGLVVLGVALATWCKSYGIIHNLMEFPIDSAPPPPPPEGEGGWI